MGPKKRLNVAALALGTVLIASSALAGQTLRDSGSILSKAAAHDSITIEETGPWQGPSTRPLRCGFRLTPRSTVALAVRKDSLAHLEGEFVAHPFAAKDLRTGDFVTVTSERDGGELVAARIVVIRPTMESRVEA